MRWFNCFHRAFFISLYHGMAGWIYDVIAGYRSSHCDTYSFHRRFLISRDHRHHGILKLSIRVGFWIRGSTAKHRFTHCDAIWTDSQKNLPVTHPLRVASIKHFPVFAALTYQNRQYMSNALYSAWHCQSSVLTLRIFNCSLFLILILSNMRVHASMQLYKEKIKFEKSSIAWTHLYFKCSHSHF